MKSKATELKKKLEQVFRQMTDLSEEQVRPEDDIVQMDDATRKAFDAVEENLRQAIRGALDPDAPLMLLEAEDTDDLRLALAFRPYYAFEAWHVSKDVSEEALLAAEKDILAGRIKKLESLRDQSGKLDFSMPKEEPYLRYMRLLNNLAYLFWVWAHEAKRFDSFAAAKCFLRAISLINVRKTRVVPNFSPEDIDTLVEYMLDGAEELRLAADYRRLADWETFRSKEAASFAAAMKEFEAFKKKDGK